MGARVTVATAHWPMDCMVGHVAQAVRTTCCVESVAVTTLQRAALHRCDQVERGRTATLRMHTSSTWLQTSWAPLTLPQNKVRGRLQKRMLNNILL